MGSDRSGIWRESGIVDRIPNQGLPVLWRAELGEGYSGPAISKGRVFVTDYLADEAQLNNNPSQRDSRNGSERILCLELSSGKQLWQFSYPRSYHLSYAAGPRATPTVDGSHVYSLGAEGDLICLQCNDGKVVWRKQLAEEYKTPSPILWCMEN
jgi:outer membrane protein assembly factor BamB